jgi:uncharacterized SAM-binding protein YcdF (DUF218 family)
MASRKHFAGMGLWLGSLGGVVLLVALIPVEITLFSLRSDPGPADAAIVLGAAVFRDAPSPVFEERIRHAVALYKAGRVRKLIMTGGLGQGDHVSEAEAARGWSVAQGVPSEDILLEARSRTTQENLANTVPLLQQHNLGRVLLVSDPLHMRRAVAIAREHGIEAHPSPTRTSRYTGWKSWTGFLMGEAYYLTRCRIMSHC